MAFTLNGVPVPCPVGVLNEASVLRSGWNTGWSTEWSTEWSTGYRPL